MFYRYKFSDVRVLKDVNIKYFSINYVCVSTFYRRVISWYLIKKLWSPIDSPSVPGFQNVFAFWVQPVDYWSG